jgi:hypothetical protein
MRCISCLATLKCNAWAPVVPGACNFFTCPGVASKVVERTRRKRRRSDADPCQERFSALLRQRVCAPPLQAEPPPGQLTMPARLVRVRVSTRRAMAVEPDQSYVPASVCGAHAAGTRADGHSTPAHRCPVLCLRGCAHTASPPRCRERARWAGAASADSARRRASKGSGPTC